MPNYVKVDTNEVENGYIYKHLNNRMNILESEFKNINNLLKNLTIKNDTVDLKDLLDELSSKVSQEALDYHINDDRIHVSGEMKTFMENNRFLPRKYSIICTPDDVNFEIVHNLNTEEITVGIMDMSDHMLINRDVEVTGMKTINVKFLGSDLGKSFRVTVLS